MRAYSGDAGRDSNAADTRMVPEVFFVSTHADVVTHSEAPYHWNDTEADFERARQRLVAERLRLLREALADGEHCGLLRDDGSNMCAVSPRDVHQVLYRPALVVPIIKACTLTMFHAFVDTLVAWLIAPRSGVSSTCSIASTRPCSASLWRRPIALRRARR